MIKNLFKFSYVALCMGVLTSCFGESTPTEEKDVTYTVSAYVLNSGDQGLGNASLQAIDLISGNISGDLYKEQNGESLGDVAQDLIRYGSKLYCTVSGSSKLVVMDGSCKVIRSIPVTDNSNVPTSPRYLTHDDNGYVYFTAYDGTVTKIDTTSLSIAGKVEVGEYPEGIAFSKGKLYVNIYGNSSNSSVAVVNTSTFSKITNIPVALHPGSQCKVDSEGKVYVVSDGNQAGNHFIPESDWVYSTVQQIDPSTDTATTLCNGSLIDLYDKFVFSLYQEFYLPERNKFFVYSLEKKNETPFLNVKEFDTPNGLNIDANTGTVFICEAPHTSMGKVSIYNLNGVRVRQFDAQYQPSKVVFNYVTVREQVPIR